MTAFAQGPCGALSFGTPQLTNDGMAVDVIYTNPPSNIDNISIEVKLSNFFGEISLASTVINGSGYNAIATTSGIALDGNGDNPIIFNSSVIATVYFMIPVGTSTTIDFGSVTVQKDNADICSSGSTFFTIIDSN